MSLGGLPRAAGDHPDDEGQSDVWVVTVDLPFMRAVLRRRRLLLVLVAVLGGLLGLGASLFLGSGSRASVTLLLSHDPAQDPTAAVDTDLGLLRTRALAEQVISDLHLSMDANDFLSTVSVANSTGQLMSLAVAAPDAHEAVARADALGDRYLTYRADVLTDQADALISGYEDQISGLRERSRALTAEITARSSSTKPADTQRVNELLAERADATGQASDLQQTIESERVRLAAVLDASRVVDPAAPEPNGSRLGVLLGFASGSFGALALTVVLVLALAMFNDRPRRRVDVARATNSRILVSVGRLRLPFGSSRRARRRVVEFLKDALLDRAYPAGGLALLGVGGEREAVLVGTDLIRAAATAGVPATGVDVTARGSLARALRVRPTPVDDWDRDVVGPTSPSRIWVLRPGPEETSTRRIQWATADERSATPKPGGSQADAPATPPGRHRRRQGAHGRELKVVVGALDPAIGADMFATWADDAVLVLRAGGASAQLLRTAARQVRASGLSLSGVVLTGSDGTDESLGEPPTLKESFTTSHREAT